MGYQRSLHFLSTSRVRWSRIVQKPESSASTVLREPIRPRKKNLHFMRDWCLYALPSAVALYRFAISLPTTNFFHLLSIPPTSALAKLHDYFCTIFSNIVASCVMIYRGVKKIILCRPRRLRLYLHIYLYICRPLVANTNNRYR